VSGSEDTIETIDISSTLSSPGLMNNNSMSGSSMVGGEADTSGAVQGHSSPGSSANVTKATGSPSGFKHPAPQ